MVLKARLGGTQLHESEGDIKEIVIKAALDVRIKKLLEASMLTKAQYNYQYFTL
ncbi:hypothetical protein PPAR_a2599 [Pseudoalteromonas paragorgicola KMM 3548]|nr:hypothetical protein [Pseudoalteromonas distincta KMM 3548]